ncbi:MAG: phosphopentomutase [Candidatus Stahlbacteria bacterium]|nr:phosphopentomutase [Candidatus Stahlbacteria bacterium]
MKRVIVLLIDGLGCGELPDADKYGDKGSNTLGNLAQKIGGLALPTFEKLGLGNIITIKGILPCLLPLASYGKAVEVSPGKDSTTGHWELMGVILEEPFPVYADGFPLAMIGEFEAVIGKRVLGGWPASGTEIIQELGEEHQRTGYPIIYTSADSVFQIAAHKEVIGLGELYWMCERARDLFPEVGRIIARPFIGDKERGYKRTDERKDYSLSAPEETLLDLLSEEGIPVISIGKVADLFAGRGVSRSIEAKGNSDIMREVLVAMGTERAGLIFANLIDFDMLWGHRNDAVGFAAGLKEVEAWLPKLLGECREEDILIITADHGVDPTTPSTDHSREYVPILSYSPGCRGVCLGIRGSFADIGATIGEYLGVELGAGKSFLREMGRWELESLIV